MQEKTKEKQKKRSSQVSPAWLCHSQAALNTVENRLTWKVNSFPMEDTEEVLGLDVSLRQITAPTTYTQTGDGKNESEMVL